MKDVALTAGVGMALTKDSVIKHSRVGRKGDLAVELHYGDFGTGHGRQAALYLARERHPDDGVYVPLSEFWKFMERDAFDVMIPPLAKKLYPFLTRFDLFRVMDALLEYLDELRKSPPDPDIYRDRSLNAFLEGCIADDLDFTVKVGGKVVVSTR